MPPRLPTFTRRLRAIMEAAGLSAYALAQKSGVSKQALSRILAGKSEPSWETACRLADALACCVSDFRDFNFA